MEPAVLQAAIEESAGLVGDGDLAVTSLSLKFAVTVLKAQPQAAGAVCDKVQSIRTAEGGREGAGGGLGTGCCVTAGFRRFLCLLGMPAWLVFVLPCFFLERSPATASLPCLPGPCQVAAAAGRSAGDAAGIYFSKK